MKKLSNYLVPFAFLLLAGCQDSPLALIDVTITAVSPTSAYMGDTVVITGTGLAQKQFLTQNSSGATVWAESKAKVFLGAHEADVIAASPTQITVKVPEFAADPGHDSGPTRIEVSQNSGNGEKTAVGPVFTYLYPSTDVTISSISPDSARVGDTVTITGTNFYVSGGQETEVLFGNQQATIVSYPNGEKLKVIVPQDTGAVSVTVAVLQEDNTTKSATAPFTYISDAPPPSGSGMVSTLAGIGGVGGYVDGAGNTAKFTNPNGIAVDAQGNIYIGDMSNALIRKITPAGVVSTVAGNGMVGTIDGAAATAEFDAPRGVAVDASGNIYVVDGDNYRIRKITPAGVVSTLAGSTQGFTDGAGAAAQFFQPTGIVVDPSGNIYVSDYIWIRKITPAGVVSTLAGSSEGFADGTGIAAEFDNLGKIAIDAQGNIYAADNSNNRIRKITPAGVVSTVAGNGVRGGENGNAATAEFSDPNGIAVDASGNIYVAEPTDIRKITPAGIVSTVAGGGANQLQAGYADGPASSALFSYEILGVAVDAQGNIYVTDQDNQCIRKITFN